MGCVLAQVDFKFMICNFIFNRDFIQLLITRSVHSALNIFLTNEVRIKPQPNISGSTLSLQGSQFACWVFFNSS